MAAPNIPSQTLPTNVAALNSWLLGDGQYVFVLKMQPTDLSGGTATLYASTDTYRGAASPPRLRLPSISISILNENFGVGVEGGRIDYQQFKSGVLGYGGFEIINTDAQYDSWVTSYGWGDAECELRFGAKSDAIGSLKTFLTFKVSGEPEFNNDLISFRVKGGTVNPNGQIQTATFAGTGSYLTEEGTAYHEGKTKPVCIGKVDNIEPVLIDPAQLRYLIDDDGVDAIGKVYESGYDIGASAWSATLGSGYFDLQASAQYPPVTADVTGKARQGASDYSLGANFKTLVADFASKTAPTVAGLSEQGGFYIPIGANATFENYLQYSIRPLGIYWTAQDGSKLLAGEIGAPEDGTAVKTLTNAHIANIDRQQTSPPVWSVRVGYRPLGTTLSSFVGAVDDDEQARLRQDTRFIEASDATVLTNYPNAIALETRSSLFNEADASTLASELLAILKIKRNIYRVDLVRHPMCAWIGQIVELEYPRYGLSGGKKVMVCGWDVDLNSRRFSLLAWG